MTETVKLTVQEWEVFSRLLTRYPAPAAKAAAQYIHSPNGDEAIKARRAVADLFGQHHFDGAGQNETAYFLEFLLEVSELRAIEALRPREWHQLVEHLPAVAASPGGE